MGDEIWNEAIEAAARAAEAADRTGREWVPGSLWDAIKKDTARDIRKLKRAAPQSSARPDGSAHI